MLFVNRLKFPLLLFLVCLVAYLPISSFVFAPKNDAFVFNFPNKYFFSEAIRSGYSPAWNPYLNFGFPLYADPGFAWWQPITWLFGLIGYNAYTFSIEILFYLYLSGLGMYWLIKKLGLGNYTAFSTGVIFMCSGFFIGNLQHINFLTCSAFLPWLFGSWWLYQKDSSIKNLFACSVFSYLFCTGGHPAIPVAGSFYFLCLTVLLYFLMRRQLKPGRFILNQVKLVTVIVVFLMPLLLSYYQIYPYYTRFGVINQSTSKLTGFTLQSYVSFLYPFATIKNFEWFGTDVSMRNGYFSIPGFLFFIVFLQQKQKSKLQIILFFSGLLLLILSLGGTIKQVLYERLPMFSSIRTNGEFRVFAIFSFLICMSYLLENFYQKEKTSVIFFKKVLIVGVFISFVGVIVLLFLGVPTFSFSFNGTTLTQRIKNSIDNIEFGQSLFISFFITSVLLLLYFFALKRSNRLFLIVLLFDVVFSSWMLLPITGVGKASASQIQSILQKSPKGFPSPLLHVASHISPEEEYLVSNWSWYDKKINHAKIDYPSELKTYENFLNSCDTALIQNKPFIFLKNGVNAVDLTEFRTNSFVINVRLTTADTLIVLQNYFPGWLATVNNKPASISKYLKTFIAVPLPANAQTVRIHFLVFKQIFSR
jgi:hypothetical protein